MTEADLAKTLEGLSAAATQGACEVLAPDTEHDFGVPIVATDYPGTYGPTNGLVLWATMQPTEIDTKDATRAQANAAFTAALWNAYRTGKLIVVDHPQATSPVDDRGGAVCEQQAVEAVAMALCQSALGGKRCPCEESGRFNCVNECPGQYAQAAIDAMPSLAAKDAEIARLREALTHYAADYDHERKCSQWDGGAIARQALRAKGPGHEQ